MLQLLNKTMPNGCCSIYKTMDAWGPDLCNIHIRTVTQLLIQEAKLTNYNQAMELVSLAVAVARENISKKFN